MPSHHQLVGGHTDGKSHETRGQTSGDAVSVQREWVPAIRMTLERFVDDARKYTDVQTTLGGCVRHRRPRFRMGPRHFVCQRRPTAQESATAAVQDLPGQPVTFSINGPAQRLEMVVATSRILTLEYKIPRLLVNNPEVVRATPISPNQVQLSALHPGVTQLNVWDENKNLYTVDVVVTPDGRQLQMLIKSEFPDANVRVRPLANSVYLSGYVPSPAMVQSIVRIAEDYYPNVVNNLTIGGVQQILLKTKVMEVSRTKLRQAGFDWAYLDGQDFVFQTVSGLAGRHHRRRGRDCHRPRTPCVSASSTATVPSTGSSMPCGRTT